MITKQISIVFMRQCFSFDDKTGDLIWKIRPLDHFASLRACNRFNTLFAGTIAGHKWTHAGIRTAYVLVGINGRQYRAHRVAWAITHGKWPADQIDHIDGNGLNNSINNLREVSASDNNKNQPRRVDNKSGITGVVYDARRESPWIASVRVDGKKIHLGGFETIDGAASARYDAEKKYGFHCNHGR
jgi:hypothetical protein